MAKYHINSKGEPGVCSAQINCPFGGAEHHYENKEDAREAYELSMAGKGIPFSLGKKKKNMVLEAALERVEHTIADIDRNPDLKSARGHFVEVLEALRQAKAKGDEPNHGLIIESLGRPWTGEDMDFSSERELQRAYYSYKALAKELQELPETANSGQRRYLEIKAGFARAKVDREYKATFDKDYSGELFQMSESVASIKAHEYQLSLAAESSGYSPLPGDTFLTRDGRYLRVLSEEVDKTVYEDGQFNVKSTVFVEVDPNSGETLQNSEMRLKYHKKNFANMHSKLSDAMAVAVPGSPTTPEERKSRAVKKIEEELNSIRSKINETSSNWTRQQAEKYRKAGFLEKRRMRREESSEWQAARPGGWEERDNKWRDGLKERETQLNDFLEHTKNAELDHFSFRIPRG